MKYLSIILIIFLAVVLVIGLGPKLFSSSRGRDFSSSEEANDIEPVGSPDGIGAEPYVFVYTRDSRGSEIKEGELMSRITGAKVITNVSQLPEGSFIPGYDFIDLVDEDGNYIYYAHNIPAGAADAGLVDFVLSDGAFIDGVYMVTLDIELENRGCACRTLLDDDYPGTFYDPYLLKVSDLFTLYTLGKSAADVSSANGPNINRISLSFFSDYGMGDPDAPDARFDYDDSVTDYKMSVRLEPGETKTITLGYIVHRRPSDGVLPAPGDLFAACETVRSISDSDKYPAVYLGLDWPEGSGKNR